MTGEVDKSHIPR